MNKKRDGLKPPKTQNRGHKYNHGQKQRQQNIKKGNKKRQQQRKTKEKETQKKNQQAFNSTLRITSKQQNQEHGRRVGSEKDQKQFQSSKPLGQLNKGLPIYKY